jgi:hypothetical protein
MRMGQLPAKPANFVVLPRICRKIVAALMPLGPAAAAAAATVAQYATYVRYTGICHNNFTAYASML